MITERDSSVGNWKDVLEGVLAMPAPPSLIVVSHLADEHLWAEALNLGVYDELAKPLDDKGIVRVLSVAFESPARDSGRANVGGAADRLVVLSISRQGGPLFFTGG